MYYKKGAVCDFEMPVYAYLDSSYLINLLDF